MSSQGSSSRTLSRDDIIETTGLESPEDLDNIRELEILFLTFDFIGALETCRYIKKLSLLDNGIKQISNLHPIRMSLQVLRVCDQEIVKMENLDLPHLKELYLHRNNISNIEGLNGCPKLRKLWLSQNKITKITNLNALPDLEECWLQANQISKLDGFEHNKRLKVLGIAGNPIAELKEIYKLRDLISLKSLSFHDIHFGRSEVVDVDGYKEYVFCNLRQVEFLDGVRITKEKVQTAERERDYQFRSYNDALREIEDDHRHEVALLDSHIQSRENHVKVLEKEMKSALRELQGLVTDGRSAMSKQLAHHESLLSKNNVVLVTNIKHLVTTHRKKLVANIQESHDHFDLTSASFCALERIIVADNVIQDIFRQIISTGKSSNRKPNSKDASMMSYHCLHHNSPDFHFIGSSLNQNLIQILGSSGDAEFDSRELSSQSSSPTKLSAGAGSSRASLQKSPRQQLSSALKKEGPPPLGEKRQRINSIEVVRLYKIYNYFSSRQSPTLISNLNQEQSSADSVTDMTRFFAILSSDQLYSLLQHGLSAAGKRSSTILFSNNLSILSELQSSASSSFTFTNETSYGESMIYKDHILQHSIGKGAAQTSEFLQMYYGNNLEESVKLKALFDEDAEATRELNFSSAGVSPNSKKSPPSIGPSISLQEVIHPKKLVRLKEALEQKTLLIIICHVSPAQMGKLLFNCQVSPTPIMIPSLESDKTRLLASFGLSKEKEHVSSAVIKSKCHVLHANGQEAGYILSIPTTEDIGDLSIDYVAIAVTPGLANGGLKVLESTIDHLMLPVAESERASKTVDTMEESIQSQMQWYIDKVMEELQESEAHLLQQASNQISLRDNALRRLRDEIEFERKHQETILRDLKHLSITPDSTVHNGIMNPSFAAGSGPMAPNSARGESLNINSGTKMKSTTPNGMSRKY